MVKGENGEFVAQNFKFECVVPETVTELETWSSWSDCSEVCGKYGVRERVMNGALENERCNVKKCDVQTTQAAQITTVKTTTVEKSGVTKPVTTVKPTTPEPTTTATTTTTPLSTTSSTPSDPSIMDCSNFTDKRQQCQVAQWRSECFGKFADWMSEECSRTCCEEKVNKTCTDEYSQCKDYESSCKVAKYIAFMTTKCAKTCGTCATRWFCGNIS